MQKFIRISIATLLVIGITASALPAAFAVSENSSVSARTALEMARQCKAAKRTYQNERRTVQGQLKKGEITKREASQLIRPAKNEWKNTCKEARRLKQLAQRAYITQKKNKPAPRGNQPADELSDRLTVSSTSFENDTAIPLKYAYTEVAAGENVSPNLSWTTNRIDIASYALLMYDTHAVANNYVHWCVTGIPASTTSLAEGASGTGFATEWTNGYTAGYEGPFPPPGSGEHTYKFKVVGLNTADVTVVDSSGYCTVSSFNAGVEGKVLAEGEYEGTYER